MNRKEWVRENPIKHVKIDLSLWNLVKNTLIEMRIFIAILTGMAVISCYVGSSNTIVGHIVLIVAVFVLKLLGNYFIYTETIKKLERKWNNNIDKANEKAWKE